MGRLRAEWLAPLVLATVLVAGAAQASVADGDFEVRGDVTLPPASTLRGDELLAAFDGDTAHASFSLVAPSVRVHAYEARSLGVRGIVAKETSFDERSWTLTNVQVRLTTGGDHSGSLGIDPTERTGFTLVATESPEIESRQESQIPEERQVSNDEHYPLYSQAVSGRHAYVVTPGTLESIGPQSIKITGLDLHLVAAENETDIVTGLATSPPEVVYRWVKIEMGAGTIALATDGERLEVAARSMRLAWDGAASFTPTSGGLRSDEGEYATTQGSAQLDGRFTALFTPTANGATLSNVDGNLRATSLRFVPKPVAGSPALDALRPWLAVAGLGTVAAASGAGYVLLRSRRARTGADAHALAYYTHYAKCAANRFRPRLALDWLEAARAEGLEDADAAIWRGILYAGLGQRDAALASYDAAVQLAPHEGEADVWAAALLMDGRGPNDRDRALERLERALRRQPALLGAIEGDVAFAPLHGVDFSEMVDEAARRLEIAQIL